MKKFILKFLATGIWLQPIFLWVIVIWLRTQRPDIVMDKETWIGCVGVSIIPTLIIWADQLKKPKEENAWTGKSAAMYPEVDKHLLQKEPTKCVIFGRDRRTRRWIAKSLNTDGHTLIIGGSGSGKTSTVVIPTLLANRGVAHVTIDIKGEISAKTAKKNDSKALIFNPDDRDSWGYDPFFELNEESSTQEVLETVQIIAFSLISIPPDVKDPFWKQSARNLFTGLTIYFYKNGIVVFVEIIDAILSRPVRKIIAEILSTATPGSVEYRYIVGFSGMEDVTLSGIVTEMLNHLLTFVNDQNIRYAFKDNPSKLNPKMLEERKSIYLTIKEERLSSYFEILRLILNQVFYVLERRPEGSDPIIMCIDELPRILSAGKLDRLLDGARTLRSRNVHLLLITQSTEALMTAYTENEVTDLISNTPYIVVLSANSPKTQKAICDWVGKFKVRKQSWSLDSDKTRTTISYDEKDILDKSELMTLQNSGEGILISPYGYNRFKKEPWYENEQFKQIVQENMETNKTLNEL